MPDVVFVVAFPPLVFLPEEEDDDDVFLEPLELFEDEDEDEEEEEEDLDLLP